MAAFDAVDEARVSYIYVYKRPIVFLRLSAPWILLYSISLFVVISIAQIGNTAHYLNNDLMRLLVEVLILFVVSLTFPIFMLIWNRFVLLDRYPRFGILVPGRAAWSFLWRWWVGSSLLSTIEKALVPKAPQLASWLHVQDATLARSCLDFLVYLVGLFVVSRLALSLPAIAVGNGEILRSPRASSPRLGRDFGLGFVLAAVLYPATDLLPSMSTLTGPYENVIVAVVCLVSAAVQYFALAVLSTYLCRAFVVTHPGYGADWLIV
jgi:hypothetical protein